MSRFCFEALLVFYVPSESGEKVTLGISALLSMTVFLMTIRESLPPTEKTPLISMYYGMSICLVSVASGLAVVTLNFHHRGVRGTRVPVLVREFVLNSWLTRFLCFNFQEDHPESVRRKNYPLHCKSETSSRQPPPAAPPQQSAHVSPNYNVGRRHTSDHSSPPLDLGKDGVIETQWAKVISRVQATIEKNERRLLDQDLRERTELEWKQVALVGDRALLLLFFLITAVSTAVILSRAPATDGKPAMS
ncbi:hypothetical protein TSAR_008451 [Trichomalopsis sarcophagae]|uniref:Neurotransmitter-gated ion-channel transmembrane domain-containing protein n=1 Tax=Trichomalopsis sarcophagae TaxID=543379 RepID=A0A232F7Z2_9HYME|nr:hypothetical protein TSAR_008451 [Trichomalopsis sarcophagae]